MNALNALNPAVDAMQCAATSDTIMSCRDFDEWWSRTSGTPMGSPRGASPRTPHMYDNKAFRRTDSNGDGVEDADTKLKIKDTLAAPAKEAAETVSSPKSIPAFPVQVEAYHMGQYTFRGAPDKVSLCQVFPASLSGRRLADYDVDLHGMKAVGPRKDSSMALSAKVMLLDILHLPLSAEPPLCVNMVVPEPSSDRQHVNSCFR